MRSKPQIGFFIDSKIGDSVVALPAIYSIKILYPQSALFLFCNSITKNLYAPFSWIDQIILIDCTLIAELNARHLDFLISSNADQRTIQTLKQSNAKKIITYLKPYNLFDFKIKTLFDNKITKTQNIKQTLLDLVWLISPNPRSPRPLFQSPKLQVFPNNMQHIHTFLSPLRSFKKPIILLNPFGFAAQINLTLPEYALLAEKLLDHFLIIVPTFAQKDIQIQANFPPQVLHHPHFFIFHNDADLLNLVALTSHVDLLISPSTGNIHIADNLEIPSIAIFSKKDRALWGGNFMHYILPETLSSRSKIIEEILHAVPLILKSKKS